MTLTIWKYEILGDKNQEISMPRGAKVLTVQMQNNTLCIWALVDPEQPPRAHVISVYGTGHAIHPDDEAGRYIGTFQDGWYVGHVFDWTATEELG